MGGYGPGVDQPEPVPLEAAERRRRRRRVLDELREGAELRARLKPRAVHLERARDLLRQRTLRG
jgi:urease accessory protein UreE